MNWQSKNLDSRRIFVQTLMELAEQDDSVCLIVCDVGFNYIEDFQKKFPHRYWNLGVTEPSSMAEVAGMAIQGMKPYIYSMVNFVTARTHEMTRNAIKMHNANVKIIGVEGGPSYRMLGWSHNLLWEDEEIQWLEKLMPCYKPKTEEVKDLIIKLNGEKNASYTRL